MNDEELGRLLSGAFQAQARDAVPDHAQPPQPRFATDAARPGRRRAVRLLAPLAAAAAVVLLVAGVFTLTDNSGRHVQAGGGPTGGAGTSRPVAGTPVHIKLLNSDGERVGVGMPVIAYFSKKVTDGRALQAATSVTINGTTDTGAWYWERSKAHRGYPYEAHFRLENYWPAHAKIHIGIPARGLSAGKGMSYDDNLTLDFTTGASHIAVVDDTTHMLTLTSDGKTDGRYPVSLGARKTPTMRGTKVIMEKGASICATGPGYHLCGIKYTQRLTYGGEYLHAAPWNRQNIEKGIDSSNGCTNLLPADAKKLYRTLEVGDVVMYPNANGPTMQLGLGYGDWNVPWATWLTGGLVRTH